MSGCEIVTQRVFPVSRERLFAAFGDEAQLVRWWGPRGFANEFAECDFREGGAWRFDLIAPDGTRFANASRFREIVAPESLAIEHGEPGHWYWLDVALDETEDGTRLTWRMRFATEEETQRLHDFIADKNEENFDRLAAFLAGQAIP